MSLRCCAKPIATIIKVGTTEAGIIGLEAALRDVYVSGIKDEEQIKADLLRRVREFGNYISLGTEAVYQDALLREYRNYITSITSQKAGKQ